MHTTIYIYIHTHASLYINYVSPPSHVHEGVNNIQIAKFPLRAEESHKTVLFQTVLFQQYSALQWLNCIFAGRLRADCHQLYELGGATYITRVIVFRAAKFPLRAEESHRT